MGRLAALDRLRPLYVPLGLLALWYVATLGARSQDGLTLLVPPSAFLQAVWDGLRDGSLPGAIVSTLARALSGFVIGSTLGLGVGLVIGLWRRSSLVLSPTLDGLRQVALFAWIPLLSAWFGNGEVMKVTLISLGAFFPVALATGAGFANVALPFREVGRTLELDHGTTIIKIILPAAAPEIVAGLELALNIAWLGTIGAEYLIGTGYINGMGDGVGAYLAAAREYARMDRVLVGVLSLALVGLLLDRSVAHLSRRLFPWQAR